MIQINDLKIGDEAVIRTGEYPPYKIGKVEKITKTQITIAGLRFNKKTGEGRDTWSTRQLVTIAHIREAGRYRLMTADEANRINEKVAQEQELRRLANEIRYASISDLVRLGLDELTAFVAKLEALKDGEQ